jgi:hypothetical protein
MSKLATLMIAAILGIYIVHGPRAAAVAPIPDWIALTPANAASPAQAPFAHAVLPFAMGPDPGAKSGTQAVPETPDAITDGGFLRASARIATARSAADAEYQAQLRECDCLDGDARNHCIEYVKLRSGRS